MLVRNVAIVGASGQAQHLVSRLRLEDAPWKRIVGIFDDRRTRISREVNGFPVLGSLDDLVRYVRSGKIHDVVITLPWSADDRLVTIIGKLRALPVHIYLGIRSDRLPLPAASRADCWKACRFWRSRRRRSPAGAG